MARLRPRSQCHKDLAACLRSPCPSPNPLLPFLGNVVFPGPLLVRLSRLHSSLPSPHADSLNKYFNAASRSHEPEGFRLARCPARNSTLQRWPGCDRSGQRELYHAYLHRLVSASQDNLKLLDDYMCQDDEDAHLVISVLDKLDGDVLKRHAGYHNEAELKTFLHEDKRDGVKMRLILAEQQGPSLASGVMEALGASPKLDPRFFQWSIRDDIHLWSPSERQRAPFGSIGFMVTKERTQEMTDIDVFHVLIYVQPDAVDDGWTDRQLDGISEDQSVYHVAEITKSMAVVERGGSLGRGCISHTHQLPKDSKATLEDDFLHFLWEQPRKMADVQQRQADA